MDYEKAGTAPTTREIIFWGTRHAGDRATQMSADYLITPLHQGLPSGPGQEEEPAIAGVLGYRARCLKGRDATKAALAEVLHGRGGSRPALLFTASHGMGWPKGHANQASAQGALLCQDWSGFGSLKPDHYLAAADVAADARVHGLVAFHFACYCAGTPMYDPFLTDRGRGPVAVAERAFVAALPQRLLAHPNGSALAVLGHIERAWGYSIMPPGVGPQLGPFRNTIGRILAGEPVGHATKDFSERYATLSAELLGKLDTTQPGPRPTDSELDWTWIEQQRCPELHRPGRPGRAPGRRPPGRARRRVGGRRECPGVVGRPGAGEPAARRGERESE